MVGSGLMKSKFKSYDKMWINTSSYICGQNSELNTKWGKDSKIRKTAAINPVI